MVEMLETAAILNQATGRSLVILDEVGRGTSTHDGLSIAQACMEYLHDVVGCRTLFATYFHELADVADAMPRATCMATDAATGRHGDVFTYRIGPGRAGRSHGLKVNTVHLGVQRPYITGQVFWDRQRWRVFLPAFQPAFVLATTSASA